MKTKRQIALSLLSKQEKKDGILPFNSSNWGLRLEARRAKIFLGKLLPNRMVPSASIQIDPSRTARGLCRESDCPNSRRNGSARCEQCSIRYHRIKNHKRSLEKVS